MDTAHINLSYSPFFRFFSYVQHEGYDVLGPRTCYVPSFYLVTNGLGQLHLGDKIYNLIPGVQLYIEAGKSHTWVSDANEPLQFNTFFFEWKYQEQSSFKVKTDFFESTSLAKHEWIRSPVSIAIMEYVQISDSTTWSNYFNQLSSPFDIIDASLFPKTLRAQARFLLLLDLAIHLADPNKKYMDPRIKKVMQSIERSITEPTNEENILITKMEAESGLSRSRFYSLYVEQTGFSPHEYLQHCRMTKAKEDLRDSTLSITEIAKRCGYSGVHNFSKMFRKHEGMSPTQYRTDNKIY